MVIHPIEPVYDENSRILILGSFPSVKSRENGFYYGHPQNRFWKVLAGIYGEVVPSTIDEKTEFLLSHNIALWDVIKSCDIVGSSDSSIKNVTPNDITQILNIANISTIYVNGKKAESLYKKYIEKEININAICLPSTSPANASYNYDRLLNEWRKAIKDKIII